VEYSASNAIGCTLETWLTMLTGEGDWSSVPTPRKRLSMAKSSDPSSPGGGGGLHDSPVRGRSAVCCPRQTSNDHAKRYSTRETNPWHLGRFGLKD
jgi:hypothetical protein